MVFEISISEYNPKSDKQGVGISDSRINIVCDFCDRLMLNPRIHVYTSLSRYGFLLRSALTKQNRSVL